MVQAKKSAPPAAPAATAAPAAPTDPNQKPAGAPVDTGTEKPKKEKAPREKTKKRSDFTGPTAWVDFCQYKKERILAKIPKLQQAAEQWEQNKAGEEVAKSEKKVKKLAATIKKVDAAKAELRAMGIDLKALGLE